MRQSWGKLGLALAMSIAATASATAQQQAPKQKSGTPTATLYRVDGGMFDMREGDIIDLTDRKILLKLIPMDRNDLEKSKRIKLQVTGSGSRQPALTVGDRLDLHKTDAASELLKDKKVCYLDLIGLTVPKAVPYIATFRFVCE